MNTSLFEFRRFWAHEDFENIMEDFSPFMGSIVAPVIFQRSDLILTKFLKIMNWKSFEIWTRVSIDSPRNRIIGGYISYIISDITTGLYMPFQIMCQKQNYKSRVTDNLDRLITLYLSVEGLFAYSFWYFYWFCKYFFSRLLWIEMIKPIGLSF